MTLCNVFSIEIVEDDCVVYRFDLCRSSDAMKSYVDVPLALVRFAVVNGRIWILSAVFTLAVHLDLMECMTAAWR